MASRHDVNINSADQDTTTENTAAINKIVEIIKSGQDRDNICSELIKKCKIDLDEVADEGKSLIMLAAEYGRKDAVGQLITAGAKVNDHFEKMRETALTLVREELVVLRLAQSAGQSDDVKSITEDEIRCQLDARNSNTMDSLDYVNMLGDILCQKSKDNNLGPKELKDWLKELRGKFEAIPNYTAIRLLLLRSGGFDVRHIQYRETR